MSPPKLAKSKLKKSAKYLVYKTTNTVNNKIYIGYHKFYDINDGYIGCGVTSQSYANSAKKYNNKVNRRSAFIDAVVKYGYNKFTREDLYIFDNKADAINMEKCIVDYDFIMRSDTYNISLGGNGGSNAVIYSDNEISEMINLLESGHTYEEISNKIRKGSKSVVRNNLKKYIDLSKIPQPSRLPPLKKSTIDKWIDLEFNRFLEMYLSRDITIEGINEECPFHLMGNSYCMDKIKECRNERNGKYLLVDYNFVFTKEEEISDFLGIPMFRNGYHSVCCGKSKSNKYKGYKFEFNK